MLYQQALERSIYIAALLFVDTESKLGSTRKAPLLKCSAYCLFSDCPVEVVVVDSETTLKAHIFSEVIVWFTAKLRYKGDPSGQKIRKYGNVNFNVLFPEHIIWTAWKKYRNLCLSQAVEMKCLHQVFFNPFPGDKG